MLNKILKPGLIITKVQIWNRCGNENDESECELTFNDESTICYICDDVDELENENDGIYELNSDGTYTQVEDWE